MNDREMPPHRLAGMSAADMERLANTEGNVVMQPTYDVVFTPWEASRVKDAVRQLTRISRRCSTKDDARAEASKVPLLSEFSQKYQIMFDRLCDPRVAANESHVATIEHMIRTFDRFSAGTLSESEARADVSDFALSGLLSQMPNAPRSTGT